MATQKIRLDDIISECKSFMEQFELSASEMDVYCRLPEGTINFILEKHNVEFAFVEQLCKALNISVDVYLYN